MCSQRWETDCVSIRTQWLCNGEMLKMNLNIYCSVWAVIWYLSFSFKSTSKIICDITWKYNSTRLSYILYAVKLPIVPKRRPLTFTMVLMVQIIHISHQAEPIAKSSEVKKLSIVEVCEHMHLTINKPAWLLRIEFVLLATPLFYEKSINEKATYTNNKWLCQYQWHHYQALRVELTGIRMTNFPESKGGSSNPYTNAYAFVSTLPIKSGNTFDILFWSINLGSTCKL